MKRTFLIEVDENIFRLKVDGTTVLENSIYLETWKDELVYMAMNLGTLIDSFISQNNQKMKPIPRYSDEFSHD